MHPARGGHTTAWSANACTGKLTVGHWTAPRPHRASPLSSCPAHAAPPAQPATTTHPADPMQDCCDKKATLGDFPRPPAPPAYASLALSTALLWLIALLVACPKKATLAYTRPCPPPSSPSPRASPGERTSGHRRAGTTPSQPTRLSRRGCGGTHQGSPGGGGEGQKASRVAAEAAASHSHSAQNLWQSTSPHPPLTRLSGTSVTLDVHTMTIKGKPIVTLEEGRKVSCEEHQLAPRRGTKVTQVSTANTSR